MNHINDIDDIIFIFCFAVVNCDVSKWSMWSSCDRSCGKGIQSRTRLISQHPSPGGKRCPTLSQSRACLGNRCSAKYRKYKSPIVGKNDHTMVIYFLFSLHPQRCQNVYQLKLLNLKHAFNR